MPVVVSAKITVAGLVVLAKGRLLIRSEGIVIAGSSRGLSHCVVVLFGLRVLPVLLAHIVIQGGVCILILIVLSRSTVEIISRCFVGVVVISIGGNVPSSSIVILHFLDL